jgi:hypothetical protein
MHPDGKEIRKVIVDGREFSGFGTDHINLPAGSRKVIVFF